MLLRLQEELPKRNRAQSRIGNGPISVGYPAHKDARPERDRRGPSSAPSGCRNVLGSPRGHLAVAEPRVVTGDLQEIRIDKPRVQAVRRDLESKSCPHDLHLPLQGLNAIWGPGPLGV
jgi:hypothetical protein